MHAIFLLPLAALGPLDVSSALGVNIHFTGAPARDLDMIREGGFGWVRMDLSWGAVEQVKGEYRFQPYDELVEGLAARGLGAILILDYSNKLYESESSVRTPEGRSAYARFAAEAAKRYRGRRVRLELWNEPNLAQFWKPEPSAEDYAALAIEAAKAIRAADPRAVILAPASSGFPLPFLEAIFERGLLEHVDEVSVHPYRNSPPETVSTDYARLRQLIHQQLPPAKRPPPIVSGEWGYSNMHYGGFPIDLDLQGAYLAREFLTNLAEGIPLSIWYDWANDGPDPKETEHNFGAVTQDRKPKPAYLAAKTLSGFLGAAGFARRLQGGTGDHLLLFQAGETTRLAAWTEREPHPALLEAPGVEGRLRALGFTGEALDLAAKGGALEVPLDGKPRYLELPLGVTKIAANGIEVEPFGFLRVRARRWGLGNREARLNVRWNGALETRKFVLEERRDNSLDVRGAFPAEVSAVLLDGKSGERLAAIPARRYRQVGAWPSAGDPPGKAPGAFIAVLDGEKQVGGEAQVVPERLEDRRFPPVGEDLRLDYRFERGWKFARIVPREPLEIPGRPAALTVWVEGDGSGNHLRARFVDAGGETFQPSGGDVSWKGWRRVEIPLDGAGAGHWGGDKNGKVDYPLRWDSLFLLDSTRAGSSGSIRFACPLLVEAVDGAGS